ncbi:hypothetical protein CN140_01580 [Sinorhizobium meliloti]|uniref:hypothetical protein n=1 Tax=Rhizobium meliloti TaxID=382 RepID=UPI000FD848DE|nr:hypothetical protein [Sinorhizobium meliloti]RVL87649.1 hypothetical protein CN140_01580 [Sinorhizobium meliloti]
MLQVGLQFDHRAVERQLTAIGRTHIPKAMAKTLNDMTFGVKRDLEADVLRNVDRPTNFTKNPWTITKAKATDGDRMFARIEAKPKQAQWFRFMITGEERHPGDPGTGHHDILAYSSKPTAAGGAFRPAFFKGTVAKAKQEKTERQNLRQQRAARSGQGSLPPSLMWVTASRNKPGSFAGEVNGTFGYWQRPKRYLKTERDRIIGRARAQSGHISSGSSRGGSSHPWTKPGERLKLLLAFKDTTKGTPTLDYNGRMRSTASRLLSQNAFWANYRSVAP